MIKTSFTTINRLFLVLHIAFDSLLLVQASTCSGGSSCGIPEYLSSTYINVAAQASGAKCAASGGNCVLAIDGKHGGSDADWSYVSGVGMHITITFKSTFPVDTLRIKQRGNTNEQNKDIKLDFSGGESVMLTLTRNHGTSYTDESDWQILSFPEVKASWVKVTVLSLYSLISNGFREIEFYKRDALRGKLCDRLNLEVGITSQYQPLFGKTVSLVLKSGGMKVMLHEFNGPSSKKYTFDIGISGKCNLHRSDGSSSSQKATADCTNIVTSTTRTPLWIDFRCSSIMLGVGTAKKLEWKDSSPLDIGYISFEATTASEIILCNRENHCYPDASHYWAFDRITAGQILDFKGNKNALTNVSNEGIENVNQVDNMFATAPLVKIPATGREEFISLGEFRGHPLINPEVGDFTLSFWIRVPQSTTTSSFMLYSKVGEYTGVDINIESNDQLNVVLRTTTVMYKRAISPFPKDKPYHVVITWSRPNKISVSFNGFTFYPSPVANVATVPEDWHLKVGTKGQGAFQVWSIALWERALREDEIVPMVTCTRARNAISTCTAALKPTCGKSYTEQQCLSVGCCYGDSQCYKRDGDGAQDTIPSIASSSPSQWSTTGRIAFEDIKIHTWSWKPSLGDTSSYLQLDTLHIHAVSHVVVRGNGANYVNTFFVSHSRSCAVFNYILDGSAKKEFTAGSASTLTVALPSSIEARCIRIYPNTVVGKGSLRAKILGNPKPINLKGCYKAGTFIAADNYDMATLTPEKCITACGLASKIIAAVKFGRYCFCGSAVEESNKVGDARCNVPCSGNSMIACGSKDTYTVYSVTGTFPSSFGCTFPANVASLTPFSGTCTANTKATCDFGESLPVTAENAPLNFTYFTVPEDFRVNCKGVMDSDGESTRGLISRGLISVFDDFDVDLDCPSYAAVATPTTCVLRVLKGTSLTATYQMTGESSSTEIQLCDAIGTRIGEVFETDEGSPAPSAGSTVLLLNSMISDRGMFMGIEVNVKTVGCLSVQILRQVCGSGSPSVYQYSNGNIELQSTNCSNFVSNCLDKQLYTSDYGLCTVNDSKPENSTIAPTNRLEVIAMNHVCFSSTGLQKIHFKQANVTQFKSGDMFALQFPASNAATISSRSVSSTALPQRSGVITYTQNNTGLGSVIQPTENVLSFVEYSIAFLAKFTCDSKLSVMYTSTGSFTEKVTVKSKSRSQEYSKQITVLKKIEGVSWFYIPGAIVNEPYSVFVSVQNGTSMSTVIRFGSTSKTASWSTAYAEQTFVHTFTQRGSEKLSLVVSNGVSMVFKECTIKVQTKVDGLSFTSPIKPVTYPAITAICFKVTQGDEVTMTADYGNNQTAVNGTFTIQDVFIGCFNHSHEVGDYNVTVTAANDASNQTVSQLVIVEKELLGLSVVIDQEFVHPHIEVNETICLNISLTQGTNPAFNVSWGDGTKVSSREFRICRHYSIYKFYNIHLDVYNNVSQLNYSTTIQVHKPVYPLANFSIVCPPTNHTNPTPCVMTIRGGNDFKCDWDWKDGLKSLSNDSHVGQSFYHTYANIGYYQVYVNCSNRLYDTVVETLAIVEKPMLDLTIGQIDNCPMGQTATAYVAVVSGSGVHFQVNKTNYHTKETVRLTPSFNPEVTNGSMTFPCNQIGVFYLEATSINNVTARQTYQMHFKVDYTIVGATVSRMTPEYVTVGDVSTLMIKIPQGSNVTCHFNFKDNIANAPIFREGVFPTAGESTSHTYIDSIDALTETICNNSVSQAIFYNVIKVQHPHKDVFMVCTNPSPFPPGTVDCIFNKPSDIPFPTNSSCTIDFGDKYKETQPFPDVLKITRKYSTTGWYDISATCINDISNVILGASVAVETPIDNDYMNFTTSGGIYGARGVGKGEDHSYFPVNYTIEVEVDWGNGTNVTLEVDWGDSSRSEVHNKTTTHIYRQAGSYQAKVTMSNAVNSETKTFPINTQFTVTGFELPNNGPVALEKPFIFAMKAAKIGTSTCFAIDVGNGTSFLYKPSTSTVCDPECNYGATVRTYSTLPLNISHVHRYIGNYDIKATACNKVSKLEVTGLANVSPKPCKYPRVNFTSFEANTTAKYAIEYRKSIKIPITPVIVIDCEATKLSKRTWGIEKCDDENFANCAPVTSNCSKEIDMDNPSLIIPERCLEYGLHRVSAQIEMLGGGTRGIFSKAHGYITITKTPLTPSIQGGTSKAVGYNKPLVINGGISYDPDTGNAQGLEFYWFCWNLNEKMTLFGNSSDWVPTAASTTAELLTALNQTEVSPSVYTGCFGRGPGRLNVSSSTITIQTDGMQIGGIYDIIMMIKKDSRWATTKLSISVVAGTPPDCIIVCIAGCGKKINPSDKHGLKVQCSCPECGTLTYHWSIYKLNKTSNQFDAVPDPQSMSLFPLTYNNLVIKPKALAGDAIYDFKIQAFDLKNKVSGFSARQVKTNPAPKNGFCDVIPRIGDSETKFNITCPNWVDDDEYITFTINLHDPKTKIDTPLNQIRSDTSTWAESTLPVGKEERGFNETVRILICDPLLACSQVDIEVQVTLKEKDESEFQTYLKDLVNVDGQMAVLLGEGRINELCAFIYNSIGNMKLIQAESHTWSDYTKSLIVKTAEFSMNFTCKIVSSDPKKASCKSSVISSILQVNASLTPYTKKVSADCLMEAAQDISAFPPSELESAATGLVSALGSSITANAATSSTDETSTTPKPTRPKTPEEIEKEKQEKKKQSMGLVNTLGAVASAFQATLVPGEDKVIETSELSMSVAKTPPSELKTVSSPTGGGVEGLGDVVDPNSTEPVVSKMIEMASNPFSWADGASDVNSPISEFSLANDDGSKKPINNLEKPIVINIPQTGKSINLTSHEFKDGKCSSHVVEVPKNHSSIHIEFIPSNENISYELFLRRNDRPTRLVYDYNFTLNYSAIDRNNTDGVNINMWFLSNEDLNYTAAGTWKFMACTATGDIEIEEKLSYNISLFTAACMFFNETLGSFSNAGVKVGPKTSRALTQCLATHATSFASDFFVPPNSIDWDKISLDELLNNPIVFIVVMVIFGLYFILLIWARRADKRDLEKIGLTPLPDNDPRDTYLYEIVVYTGHTSGAGTTSDIYMVLSGGLDETSPKKLCDPDPNRKKFLKGSVDSFLLAVPRSLGKLKELRIWHNNQGDDPSWFLQRIMVRDLQVDKKTWFVNLRWLAVEEDDGMVERSLHPATKDELTNFGLLFSTEARKNLTDNHLWFSVVARPPKSNFTRVQRLSCCLSVILTTMIANAMFYQTDDKSSAGTSVHVGPFSFSMKQVSIGITSSLVVLPVNVLVVTIFRKIKPLDPKAKLDKEKDPNGRSEKYKANDEDVPQIVVNEKDEENENDENNEEGSEEEEENEAKSKKKEKKKKKKKKSASLDPRFAYLAYVLIFLASTVSATFTVFYGLTFGKEKSEGWISSMMISFWQDVLISQPLKVFAAAMFFALVIKDPNKNEDENEQNELNPDEELVHKKTQNNEDEQQVRKLGFVAKPPDPEKLEAFRQLRLKQKQMKTIIYEIVQYLFFLVLVLVIAYGNRDPMAYGVTRTMDSFFVSAAYTATSTVTSADRPDNYWTWALTTFIPTLRPYYWYGPIESFPDSQIDYKDYDRGTEKILMKGRNQSDRWLNTGNGNYVKNTSVLYSYPEGFVADHATTYLVGSPRIRQLRIKRNQSTMLPFIAKMFSESNADYEWDLEDKDSYNHGWLPFERNQTKEANNPSPWYYRSAWELKGTPYWGFFASYWAGGYVANLGKSRADAEKLISNLSASGWIDRYSRALFAEFTVYNPYTNFFSAVTLLTEIRATGGYHPMPKVQTLRLYRYIGPEMVFIMACEISYIAFLLYFLYKQVKKYRAERREYFRDGWNYLEISLLSFSIASVGLYFARLGMTTLTISDMNDNPDGFVSFQYVAFLDEWVTATCSLAVFFSFLKFLRLLRFNRRMALLSLTLKKAAEPLFFFFVYFMIIFMAYVQFGFTIFGVSDPRYSSFHRSIVAVFGMTLGDFDFDSLQQANRIFGPLYFFTYVVVIIFILMNVFLSIIVDTFDEVNRDVLQQGNDHEMLSFMVHAVKSNMGKKCGPAIKPTYVEEKSDLEKNIDSIDEISENIQYAFRNICMEDIRQTKWFDPKKTTQKKNLVVQMLLEDEENFTENDICDAIPVLDDFIENHTIEEIVRCMVAYRDKKKIDEMAEESKPSESSAEEETEFSDEDDYDDDYDDDDDDDTVYDDARLKTKKHRRGSHAPV